MTFDEKSEQKPRPTAQKRLGQAAGSVPVADAAICTFSDVVDKACNELINKQAKHSIRRIQVMEEKLSRLEQELDDFLKNRKQQ